MSAPEEPRLNDPEHPGPRKWWREGEVLHDSQYLSLGERDRLRAYAQEWKERHGSEPGDAATAEALKTGAVAPICPSCGREYGVHEPYCSERLF